MNYDIFICHASEDKQAVARPIAQALRESGQRVWLDEWELTVGDSLRQKIDHGLANSRFGVVIVSSHFLNKEWPQAELDGLASLEVRGRKVILPVWHLINATEVQRHSPLLAGRLAASTANGIEEVVRALLRAVGENTTTGPENDQPDLALQFPDGLGLIEIQEDGAIKGGDEMVEVAFDELHRLPVVPALGQIQLRIQGYSELRSELEELQSRVPLTDESRKRRAEIRRALDYRAPWGAVLQDDFLREVVHIILTHLWPAGFVSSSQEAATCFMYSHRPRNWKAMKIGLHRSGVGDFGFWIDQQELDRLKAGSDSENEMLMAWSLTLGDFSRRILLEEILPKAINNFMYLKYARNDTPEPTKYFRLQEWEIGPG